MASENNIAKLIQAIAKKGISINDAIIGTVIEGSVDTGRGVCDVQPLNEDAKLTDVKLRTQQSKKSGTVTDFLVMAPVEGSQVICSFTSAGQAFLSMYSEIENIKFILSEGNVVLDINETAETINAASGNITFKIDDTEILLNGSNNEGLVKVVELTSRLNSIESALSSLISTFNTHAHSGVTTGPGTSGPTATPSTADPGTTTQNNIENQKVKHGE